MSKVGARRARRTAAQWDVLLAEQSRSGLTQEAFCRLRGLGYSTFSNWRARCAHFAHDADAFKVWEYAVLVTNTDYALEAIGQLYRDRADCENGFDELKNQWGWGGYTTHDLERCNLSARAVALIYNWWSGYVRLAHPKARREAITSRPLLLPGVARLTATRGSVPAPARPDAWFRGPDQIDDRQYPHGS